MIRKLNEEMEEKGMLVVMGKVSADCFAERYFGKDGGGNSIQIQFIGSAMGSS